MCSHVLPEIVCSSFGNVKIHAKIYQGSSCELVFKKNGGGGGGAGLHTSSSVWLLRYTVKLCSGMLVLIHIIMVVTTSMEA